MKKILIVSTVVVATAASSYAQGFINFQGFLHNVGNNFATPGTVSYSTGIDVELLFAPASTATAISAIASSSASSSLNYTTAAAWNLITGDQNFAAVDGTAGAGSVALFSSAGNGGGTYNSSAAYGAANLTGGTTYTFYEVAWSTDGGLYNTLAAAAAADAYVGWSQAFQYSALVSGNPPPANFTASNVGNYLVGGVVSTPEPGTMALAGLGIAGLVALRRKK